MKDPEGWGYYLRFEQGCFQILIMSRGGGGRGGGGGGGGFVDVCITAVVSLNKTVSPCTLKTKGLM